MHMNTHCNRSVHAFIISYATLWQYTFLIISHQKCDSISDARALQNGRFAIGLHYCRLSALEAAYNWEAGRVAASDDLIPSPSPAHVTRMMLS